jgi:hypothetical protein
MPTPDLPLRLPFDALDRRPVAAVEPSLLFWALAREPFPLLEALALFDRGLLALFELFDRALLALFAPADRELPDDPELFAVREPPEDREAPAVLLFEAFAL